MYIARYFISGILTFLLVFSAMAQDDKPLKNGYFKEKSGKITYMGYYVDGQKISETSKSKVNAEVKLISPPQRFNTR